VGWAGFLRPSGLWPSTPWQSRAGGPLEREGLEAGLRVLGERYLPVPGDGLLARTRYLAGDDARRLGELEAALADDAVRAVFAARGGYGCMRLLPKLRVAGGRPKLLVGFSTTASTRPCRPPAGQRPRPVVTQLGTQPREAAERLFRLLESAEAPAPPLAGTPLVPGVAEGPLVGGNLSVLTRLRGRPGSRT
jgi:muramoyltetrapeptide carboxypeptidase